MKFSVLLLISLFISLAHAGKIHRWVDADGKVHFSDRPPVAAQTQELEIKSSVSTRKRAEDEVLDGADEAAGPESEEEEKKPTVYKSIAIVSPKQGATIRTNTGQVSISVRLDPGLDSEFKHKVAVFVDGKRKGFGQGTSFTATGIFNGPRTVYAKVTDEKGKVLRTSPRVSFFVLRGGN